MKNTTIYALVDPRNNEVRYIGKADCPKSRFAHHCRGIDKTHNANWIRSIRPGKPEMLIIEVVNGEWVEAEQFWISYFKFLGARLNNHTSGGEGSIGFRHTPESIARIKTAKTNPSAETRLKISEANKKRTPESWAKMAATKKGKKQSPEAIANRSRALTGKARSPEARASIVAGHRKRSPEEKAISSAKSAAKQRGRKKSSETLAKISAALKGRVSPNKGKTASAETLLKQSVAAKAYQARIRAEKQPILFGIVF